jgi:hypothetical protein
MAKSEDDYRSVSLNYDSLETKSKDDITILVGKLPQFDGTNFTKWKHMMKAYLIDMSLELWNIVCVGFDDPEDFGNLTHVIATTSKEILKLQAYSLVH